MNDTDKTPEVPPAAEQTPAAGGAADGGEAKPALDPAALAGEVATLLSQRDDLTDRLLRTAAELDNMRKRLDREKEEVAKYAITKFAQDIVGVADNFQRAIGAVPAGAADADQALKSFIDGITMTEREFLNALERHGVRKIDPKGQPFNPHQHQAVMEQESAEVAAGTVLQVFQSGFMIEDRCLRPAMVVVSKTKQSSPGSGDDGAA